MRDVLLGNTPVFWMHETEYLWMCLATTVGIFFLWSYLAERGERETAAVYSYLSQCWYESFAAANHMRVFCFIPSGMGLQNDEFSSVQGGGAVYCWCHVRAGSFPSRRLLDMPRHNDQGVGCQATDQFFIGNRSAQPYPFTADVDVDVDVEIAVDIDAVDAAVQFSSKDKGFF